MTALQRGVERYRRKAGVVRTLDGLARFYASNANVGGLIFIVFVERETRSRSRRTTAFKALA